MARTMIISKNTDTHIASFPEPTRSKLEKLRSVISATALNAEESINYGIPTFKQNGKNLVHFAGYKNHIGFYPGSGVIETFKKELAGYTLSKGTIQFPLDKPLPVTLVKQIVKHNLKQIQETQKTLKPKTSKQKNLRTAKPKNLKTTKLKNTQLIQGMSAPATRALENAGIRSLNQLSARSEKEILRLHGMGAASLPVMRKALSEKGLAFKSEKKDIPNGLTAKKFIERIRGFRSGADIEGKKRFFKSGKGKYGEGDVFIGVDMKTQALLAKEFEGMPIPELEKLLESPVHEIRMGALSIMNRESRKKIDPSRLKDFFDLYIKRHDRINNWDLVDMSCMYMTGKYLVDKPKTILYKLAASKNFWERRTAIVSTCYFIRQGEVDETFKIAELLIDDNEDLVHKGVGWMLRSAGEKDIKKLLAFLDRYAAMMPRTMLRYSIEKFDKKKKDHYMSLKKLALK